MSVFYEVYTLVDRRWQIYAHYDEDGREQAINEANQLDRESHVTATCVVCETYDPTDNLSRETVIHYSASLKRPPSLSTLAAGKVAGPPVGKSKGGPKAAKARASARPAVAAAVKPKRRKPNP